MRLRSFVFLLTVVLTQGCSGGSSDALPSQGAVTTYRIIGGISMGAIGATSVGTQHPDRFDAVAGLGGPLDAALFLRNVDQFQLNVGCSREALESLLATQPSKLNDPAAIAACAQRPANIPYEHSQDFNNWVFTYSGDFDRSSYFDLFEDITLAYGNLLSDNPGSPFAPPGVLAPYVRSPPSGFCAYPVRVSGLYNAEYNPQGRYDAITFCDGDQQVWICAANQEVVDFCSDPANIEAPLAQSQEQAFAASYCAQKGGSALANGQDHPAAMFASRGRHDPCRRSTRPVRMALAYDYNGNGLRDYGEPVVNNGQERFDDVGTDGCADAYEQGSGGCGPLRTDGAVDPNGDNYDALNSPLGTERDWLWEPGEPYRDFGLDGVQNTHDVGEGNGAFDLSSGRKKLLANDARAQLQAMSPSQRDRLRFLLDGGIRDVFNFGLMSEQLFGFIRSFAPDQSARYRDFTEIPGMKDVRTGNFRPWGKRWDEVPHNLFVLYGKEPDQVTLAERVQGEGDHVGTNSQALDRVYTLFNWAGVRWPNLPRPETPLDGPTYSERTLVNASFDSAALGAPRGYAVFLPPGYDAQRTDVRYPVLYLLSGYGLTPEEFISTSLVADAFMRDPEVKLRPMIIVVPSGTCCFVNDDTGERDCREKDAQGKSVAQRPGFRRECRSGTFYVNRSGYGLGDATRYGDAFLELMDEVDRNYLTLKPQMETIP